MAGSDPSAGTVAGSLDYREALENLEAEPGLTVVALDFAEAWVSLEFAPDSGTEPWDSEAALESWEERLNFDVAAGEPLGFVEALESSEADFG